MPQISPTGWLGIRPLALLLLAAVVMAQGLSSSQADPVPAACAEEIAALTSQCQKLPRDALACRALREKVRFCNAEMSKRIHQPGGR